MLGFLAKPFLKSINLLRIFEAGWQECAFLVIQIQLQVIHLGSRDVHPEQLGSQQDPNNATECFGRPIDWTLEMFSPQHHHMHKVVKPGGYVNRREKSNSNVRGIRSPSKPIRSFKDMFTGSLVKTALSSNR